MAKHLSALAVALVLAGLPISTGVAQNITGAAISLNNRDANHPIYYQTAGNPAAGPDFYVEILGGTDANSLRPIVSISGGYPTVFTIGTGGNPPGFFDMGFGIVPGVGFSAVATFQVLAWTGAPNFDTASQRIASGLWTQATGASLPPGIPNPAALEFPANLVIPAIPEPSTVALCLFGFAGLFATRWRT